METKTTTTCPQELIDLYNASADDPLNRYKENYNSNVSIEKNYALCYSITTIDNKTVAGSMAWKRDIYHGAIRVGSRYTIHPDVRSKGLFPGKEYKNGIRLYAVHQLDQQIDYLITQGYKDFFISREDDTGYITDRVFNGLTTYSKYEWRLSEYKWLVCPDPTEDKCWQRIMYVGDMKLPRSRRWR